MSQENMRPVIMGRIHGLFGVRGWLKVYSYTDRPADVLGYSRWYLRLNDRDWHAMKVAAGRSQGKGLIVHLAPIDGVPLSDRDAAAAWLQADVAVDRSDLPELEQDEVYWIDLLDCQVETVEGQQIGQITDVLDNGAHPIMVIEGEQKHLIPLVRGPIVQRVDLNSGLVVVDWVPE